MKFHQLKCPNCGAELEIEDELDVFFCKYCGTKIIVEGRSDTAIKAKADITLAEKEIERQRQEHEHEERVIHERNKSGNVSFLVVIAGWIIFMLFLKFVFLT
jgi:DNA-directed RNA polymerase subunit RPC12/RpoP